MKERNKQTSERKKDLRRSTRSTTKNDFRGPAAVSAVSCGLSFSVPIRFDSKSFWLFLLFCFVVQSCSNQSKFGGKERKKEEREREREREGIKSLSK